MSHQIFSARSLGVTGRMPATALADYLSGLLIGHELRAGLEWRADAKLDHAPLALVGSPALCARYQLALQRYGGVQALVLDNTAPAGLMTPSLTPSLFNNAFDALPLVAILRGLRPKEAEAVGAALYDAGFRMIEVPLNSPQPLDSIELLSRSLPADALLGAGTVLSVQAVQDVKNAGGQLIVMPHADTEVIRAAKAAGMFCVPGAATPTEAFAALHAGADAVKLFPAELITPTLVRAMRAVLPPTLRLCR
eukprot:gene42740-53025_t